MHCQEAPVSAFHTLAAPSDAAVTTLDMSEENSADTTPLPKGNEEEIFVGHIRRKTWIPSLKTSANLSENQEKSWYNL